MLIGISGYIGSGKDTFADMVRYIYMVMYTGACVWPADLKNYKSYKDQGLDFEYSGWCVHKFAAKLKQIASILTGVPAEFFEDQKFKASEMPREWWPVEFNQIHNMDESNPITWRDFLQKLGTEAVRNNVHRDAWVLATMAGYKPHVVLRDTHYAGESIHAGMLAERRDVWPNWIITDVRFENEARAVRNAGGILVRMHRHKEPSSTHSSETSLDNYPFDVVVNNTGTEEELLESARYFVTFLKLREYAHTNRNPFSEGHTSSGINFPQ